MTDSFFHVFEPLNQDVSRIAWNAPGVNHRSTTFCWQGSPYVWAVSFLNPFAMSRELIAEYRNRCHWKSDSGALPGRCIRSVSQHGSVSCLSLGEYALTMFQAGTSAS